MGRKAKTKLDQRKKRDRPQRRRLIVGALLALLVVGSGVGVWQWNRARATPEPAPRFNLFASTGRVITLDEFLGKQEVVLFFFMGAG